MPNFAYKKRIFVFIDVLGFRDLVEESKSDPQRIFRIYNLLSTARDITGVPKEIVLKPFQKTFYDNLIVHTFSDTVTLSLPNESFEFLNWLIALTMYYQYLMWLEENVFVRGSIVFGEIYDEVTTGKVFGPALNTAYDLERKLAEWPRIIVDESVIQLLSNYEKENRSYNEYLTKDESNISFLDYLHDFYTLATRDRGKRIYKLTDPIKLFQDHKASISTEIHHVVRQTKTVKRQADKEKKILSKYDMLSQYHNSTIGKLCEILSQLNKNKGRISDINKQNMNLARLFINKDNISKEDIESFKPKYTAEKVEFVDIMPLVGIAIHKLVNEQKGKIDYLNNDPEALLVFLNLKLPDYLVKLREELSNLRIDFHKEIQNTPKS
jgi:hypothetical protein